jgi:hypothetical protein
VYPWPAPQTGAGCTGTGGREACGGVERPACAADLRRGTLRALQVDHALAPPAVSWRVPALASKVPALACTLQGPGPPAVCSRAPALARRGPPWTRFAGPGRSLQSAGPGRRPSRARYPANTPCGSDRRWRGARHQARTPRRCASPPTRGRPRSCAVPGQHAAQRCGLRLPQPASPGGPAAACRDAGEWYQYTHISVYD